MLVYTSSDIGSNPARVYGDRLEADVCCYSKIHERKLVVMEVV